MAAIFFAKNDTNVENIILIDQLYWYIHFGQIKAGLGDLSLIMVEIVTGKCVRYI